MTVLDHVADKTLGFGYTMDAATARRQFRLSIGVVIGLTMAIVAAALNVPTLPRGAPSYDTVSVPSLTLHAENDKRHAARS